MCTYTYTLFQIIFSIVVYHRLLNIVPCTIQCLSLFDLNFLDHCPPPNPQISSIVAACQWESVHPGGSSLQLVDTSSSVSGLENFNYAKFFTCSLETSWETELMPTFNCFCWQGSKPEWLVWKVHLRAESFSRGVMPLVSLQLLLMCPRPYVPGQDS